MQSSSRPRLRGQPRLRLGLSGSVNSDCDALGFEFFDSDQGGGCRADGFGPDGAGGIGVGDVGHEVAPLQHKRWRRRVCPSVVK